MIISKCKCGKRKSKYSNLCIKCDVKERKESHAEALAIVSAGVCPKCGRGLKRNNSMTGWWQCEQSGSELFRKYPDKPSCPFQTFTE